jgi:hypothetical protein
VVRVSVHDLLTAARGRLSAVVPKMLPMRDMQTKFCGNQTPVAHAIYDVLMQLRAHFVLHRDQGCAEAATPHTAGCCPDAALCSGSAWGEGLEKLDGYLKECSSTNFFKAARVFDPRRVHAGTVNADLRTLGTDIPLLRNPSEKLRLEWTLYCTHARERRDEFNDPKFTVDDFWIRFAAGGVAPELSGIARRCIWIPVASVTVERSFNQYRKVLSDERTSFTLPNLALMTGVAFNGAYMKVS